jgi:hypothetical protein
MKILFCIAVLSFAALVWAALAIVRHVRKNSARTAAQPAADAELSEALDVRLSEIVRQSAASRVPPATSAGQQDFAYFNRDATASIAAKKPFPDPPVKPAVADRP